MTVKQFTQSAEFFPDIDGLNRDGALGKLLKNGIVRASENGLVTTKAALPLIINDNRIPDISLNGKIRLGEIYPLDLYRQCMDLYNIVIDLYPGSADFHVSKGLFQMYFIDSDKGLIYELIRIPKNQEEIYRALLLRDSASYNHGRFEILREKTIRIAMVESEASKEYVPYTGFKFICTPVEGTEKGFKVLEKRSDDLWRDMKGDLKM